VRVGEAVEASAVKLCRDLLDLRKLLLAGARLRRGSSRSCDLPWEDLTPPIGVGGGDPSTAAEALASRDTALHWPHKQAVHQATHRLM